MYYIIRNVRAPPVTPRHMATRRILTLDPEGEIAKGGKMQSKIGPDRRNIIKYMTQSRSNE